jgi:hypothetical protein
LSSNVPQLGAQKKQSKTPLVVLPADQQGLLDFMKSSDLSAAKVAGRREVAIHPGVAGRKYEFGKSLIPNELVPELPTQMPRLHDYCMLASSNGVFMMGVRVKDEDCFRARMRYGCISKNYTN